MGYYVKDSFYMPHIDGVKASVVRLTAVVFAPNLFKGVDAKVFYDDGDQFILAPDVSVMISDSWVKYKLGLDNVQESASTPWEGDTLLWCERLADGINWYMVTYGRSN